MRNIFTERPDGESLAGQTIEDGRTDAEKAADWGAFYLSKGEGARMRHWEAMDTARMRQVFFQILPLVEERLASRIHDWLDEHPAPKQLQTL